MNTDISRGEIVLYQTADGRTSIDVKLENDTVWLTQAQMSILFDKDQSVIARHIKNALLEGEIVLKQLVDVMGRAMNYLETPDSPAGEQIKSIC